MPEIYQLHDNCSVFHKEAGLIKTPQVIIDRVSNWAISCFCKKLVDDYIIPHTLPRLEERKSDGEETENIKKSAKIFNRKWYELDTFLHTSISFQDATNDYYKFVFALPMWNPDKDPMTGLDGFFDANEAPAFHLSLQRFNENGQIHVFFSSQGEEHINKLVSEDDIKSELSDVYTYINNTCKMFFRFVDGADANGSNYFQTTSNQDINEVKKLIVFSNTKIQKQYPDYHYMLFPASKVLPQDIITSIVGVKNVGLQLAFASTQHEKTYIYPKENWQGLLSSEPRLQNHIGTQDLLQLGTLYVGRVMKQDVASIMAGEWYQAKVGGKVIALEEVLQTIKTTVRHEVDHAYQTLVGFLTRSDAGGVEPASGHREYSMHGKSLARPNEPRLEHSLRDVEFYTNLADSVVAYKQAINKLPLYLQQQFLRCYIGYDHLSNFTLTNAQQEIGNVSGKPPNQNQWNGIVLAYGFLIENSRFFHELQQYQPAKYQKAVKEFLKATGH